MEPIDAVKSPSAEHAGVNDRTLAAQAYKLGRADEARRIAHALHDDMAQLLVSAGLALTVLTRDLPEQQVESAQTLRGLLDALDRSLRTLTRDLGRATQFRIEPKKEKSR